MAAKKKETQAEPGVQSLFGEWVAGPLKLVGALAGGLTAVLYVAGFITLVGRNYALGLPGIFTSTNTLIRGYTFLADSAGALVDLAGGQLTATPTADIRAVGIIGVGCLGLAALGVPAISGRTAFGTFLRARGLVGWRPAAWVAVAAASAYNLYSLTGLFEVKNLLLQDKEGLDGRTLEVVEALLGTQPGLMLRAAYGIHVLLLLVAVGALWCVREAARRQGRATSSWTVTFASLSLAVQLLCLPRAHGVYVLTGIAPPCVAVKTASAGPSLTDPTGFLMSDGEDGELQLLTIFQGVPPQINLFQRSDVTEIVLQKTTCGANLLTPPNDQPEAGSGTNTKASANPETAPAGEIK